MPFIPAFRHDPTRHHDLDARYWTQALASTIGTFSFPIALALVPQLLAPFLELTFKTQVCFSLSLYTAVLLAIATVSTHRVHFDGKAPPAPAAPNFIQPMPPTLMIWGHNFYWSPQTWGQYRRFAGLRPNKPRTRKPLLTSLQLRLRSLLLVILLGLTSVAVAGLDIIQQHQADRRYHQLHTMLEARSTPLHRSLSCCYHAATENATLSFDTDSALIGIDTMSSYSVTNSKSDFIDGTFDPTNRDEIECFGGHSAWTEGKGTVEWVITDDNDVRHAFRIRDVAYVPSNPLRLLSPQHLARQLDDKYQDGTGEVTTHDRTVLFWANRKYTKTVTHHPNTDCPMMSTAPGLADADAFFQNWNYCLPSESVPLSMSATTPQYFSQVVPNDLHVASQQLFKSLGTLDNEQDEKELDSDTDSVSSSMTYTAPTTDPQFSQPPLDDSTFVSHIVLDNNLPVVPDSPPPVGETAEQMREPSSRMREAADTAVLDEIKQAAHAAAYTLTDAQRELLNIHHRLGHAPMKQIQTWAKQGQLPTASKAIRTCALPRCCDCLYAKAQKRSWRTKKAPAKIRREDSCPGSRVSVDQLEVTTPGLIPQLKGKLMKAKFTCATIFYDEFSGKDFVFCQTSTNAAETLQAKTACEQHFSTFGVEIRAYHADNGRFQENAFKQACNDAKQELTFCGVGAHHQNGLIERHIRTLSESSRAMLLHAMLRWRWVTLHLWPYALHHASYLHNHLPTPKTNKSRTEAFAQTDHLQTFEHLHTFGCPVYVLDAALQGHGKLPRYTKRARIGIYLGHSPQHAGNVALVLNPETGHVSPQYHVVFDDDFTTVADIDQGKEPANWEKLSSTYEAATNQDFDLAKLWFHTSDLHDDEDAESDSADPPPTADSSASTDEPAHDAQPEASSDPSPDAASVHPRPEDTDSYVALSDADLQDHTNSELLSDTERLEDLFPKRARRTTFDPNLPVKPPPKPPPILRPSRYQSDPSKPSTAPPERLAPTSTLPRDSPDLLTPASQARIRAALQPTPETATAPHLDPATPPARRSKRDSRRTPARKRIAMSLYTFYACMGTVPGRPSKSFRKLSYAAALHVNPAEQTPLQTPCPSIYAANASTSDNDVLNFRQAMKATDVADFKKAMTAELTAHIDRQHWIKIPRSQKPPGTKAIQMVWTFKRKRRPDGSLLKHKARLCIHGGMQQQGVNYWETYSPVVRWSTIRLLMTLSLTQDLVARQIDFILAYPHADVETAIYLELPPGYEHFLSSGENPKDFFLLLKKNVYGLKQAGRTWYQFLRDHLIARGYTQSPNDPCLFHKGQTALIIYVDDVIVYGKDRQELIQLVESLDRDFSLTDEGEDIHAYLGIKIDKTPDGTSLSQPFLIERALAVVNFSLTNTRQVRHDTPADNRTLLHADSDGPERKQEWSYRSVLGMLTYLTGTTRPDLAYAVHQCARFSTRPKHIHEIAVKRILRYLLSNPDKGLLHRPDPTKGLECFVDADFAGNFRPGDTSRSSCLSRTGYVICLSNCPIMWASKLQSSIALSTCKAEYIALSTALRDVIPLMLVMNELSTIWKIPSAAPYVIVHEDNQSAKHLATTESFKPRTRHIAVKYHHFRQYVDDKSIRIDYIPTAEQRADIFTKALPRDIFRYLREKVCGW